MNLQTIRSNPWPYAIIGWFLLFGSGMAAWVVVAVRNDPELVRPDYYEQELDYQKQIDRSNRAAALPMSASVTHDTTLGQVVIQVPGSSAVSGTIHFYRPSNAKLDFELPLLLDASGVQRIPADKLAGGLWKVRVHWTGGGENYSCDQSLVL